MKRKFIVEFEYDTDIRTLSSREESYLVHEAIDAVADGYNYNLVAGKLCISIPFSYNKNDHNGTWKLTEVKE